MHFIIKILFYYKVIILHIVEKDIEEVSHNASLSCTEVEIFLEKDEFMNKINFILKLIFKHTICPAVFKEDHKDMDVALGQLRQKLPLL